MGPDPSPALHAARRVAHRPCKRRICTGRCPTSPRRTPFRSQDKTAPALWLGSHGLWQPGRRSRFSKPMHRLSCACRVCAQRSTDPLLMPHLHRCSWSWLQISCRADLERRAPGSLLRRSPAKMKCPPSRWRLAICHRLTPIRKMSMSQTVSHRARVRKPSLPIWRIWWRPSRRICTQQKSRALHLVERWSGRRLYPECSGSCRGGVGDALP